MTKMWIGKLKSPNPKHIAHWVIVKPYNVKLLSYLSANWEHILSELSHQNLNNQYKSPNGDEHVIVLNSWKHIKFIVNHSCVDHIEESQEHKYSEDYSVMPRRTKLISMLFI